MQKILTIAIVSICFFFVLGVQAQDATSSAIPTLSLGEKKTAIEEKINILNQKITSDLNNKLVKIQNLEERIKAILNKLDNNIASSSAQSKLTKIDSDIEKLNILIQGQLSKNYVITSGSANFKTAAKKESDKLQKESKILRENLLSIQNDFRNILKNTATESAK